MALLSRPFRIWTHGELNIRPVWVGYRAWGGTFLQVGYFLTEMGGCGDEITIVLGGELDMCAAPALRDALRRAIDRRAAKVVVDLTDATFVDSTGIGALLEASARLRETRGRLHLICTNRNVLRTVEIAGLHRHIAIDRRLAIGTA